MVCGALVQLDALQSAASEIQPAAFFTLMPVTEPAATLLKTLLVCHVPPLSILYCKPLPKGLVIVTEPVDEPHNEGCTRHIAGVALTVFDVADEVQFFDFAVIL